MPQFYIYGYHAVYQRLSQQPETVNTLYLQAHSRNKSQRVESIVQLAVCHAIPIQYTMRSVLDEYAGRGLHQGMVVSIRSNFLKDKPKTPDLMAFLGSLQHSQSICLLILDGIQDPHNLGACLRTACAMGVDAVIATKNRAVGLTPVVRKVACGAADVVPFFAVTNLMRLLKLLKKQGIWIYGMTEMAAQSLYTQDLTGSVAWVLGSEGHGLRRLTQSHCDVLVKIPTENRLSTLNVSVATGICLAETRRQRGYIYCE